MSRSRENIPLEFGSSAKQLPTVEKIGEFNTWYITFSPQGGSLTLGRSQRSEIVDFTLPTVDVTTSKCHATLEVRDGKLFLRDHSKNGTIISRLGQGSTRLAGVEFELHGGEYIQFGQSTTATFHIQKRDRDILGFPISISLSTPGDVRVAEASKNNPWSV